jgi:hypothetical protein
MLLNANGLYSGLENVGCYAHKSVAYPCHYRENVPGDGRYPGAAIRSTASRKLLLHMEQREKAPRGYMMRSRERKKMVQVSGATQKKNRVT